MISFILAHEEARDRCMACIANIETDGKTEVVVRKARVGKTMQQLGGMFGVWVTHISKMTGQTENEVHDELKSNFLSKVYLEGPANEMQEMWVDLYYGLQESCEWAKLGRHRKRLSLSWATLEQMKRYMDLVQQYFISVDLPLPVLDREWRSRGDG